MGEGFVSLGEVASISFSQVSSSAGKVQTFPHPQHLPRFTWFRWPGSLAKHVIKAETEIYTFVSRRWDRVEESIPPANAFVRSCDPVPDFMECLRHRWTGGKGEGEEVSSLSEAPTFRKVRLGFREQLRAAPVVRPIVLSRRPLTL